MNIYVQLNLIFNRVLNFNLTSKFYYGTIISLISNILFEMNFYVKLN